MDRYSIRNDLRASESLITLLSKTNSDVAPPELPINVNNSLKNEQILLMTALEKVLEENLNNSVKYLKPIENVIISKITIKGVDNNDITLIIHKPINNNNTELPCIYHIHGGGMCILQASDEYYNRWRNELCSLHSNLIVIGIEYRNSAGKLGNFSFPDGLNDCVTGLKYIYNNKKELGISSIILNGESGGGNLCLSTCLFAKKLNIIHYINGVFAQCPFISNLYDNTNEAIENQLQSLIECNCYILDGNTMNIMANLYTPKFQNIKNKDILAWPYYATNNDLINLPPHIITVNELDPLRDEGIAYYRKLLKANNEVSCKMLYGTTHAGEMAAARGSMPNITESVLNDIYQFTYYIHNKKVNL